MDTPVNDVQQLLNPEQPDATPRQPNIKRQPLIRFGLLPILALFIVFTITLAVGVEMIYAHAYDGHLYRGISAMGMDMSGYSHAEAVRALQARFDQYATAPLTLRYKDRTYPTTASELGLRFDAEKAADELYTVGRRGTPVQMVGEQLSGLFSGYDAHIVFPFDSTAESAVLRDVKADLERPAINANLVLKKNGQGYTAEMTPSQVGWHVNTERTSAEWSSTFVPFKTKELNVVVDESQPAITEQNLTEARSLAQQIIGAPVTVRYGERTWQITPDMLAGMLVMTPQPNQNEKMKVELDQKKLQAQVSVIASQIDHPSKDASIKIEGGNLVIDNAMDSETADQAAILTAIESAAKSTDRTAIAVVKTEHPQITDADIADVKQRAQALFASQLLLTYQDRQFTFSKDRISKATTIVRDEKNGKPNYTLTINQDALKAWISAIADDVDRNPHNALFRMVGSQIQVMRQSSTGIAVDQDATLARVNAQLYAADHTIPLQVKVTEPEIKSADAASINVKDMLMDSSTTYAGSVPPRAHNVELAAEKLNGALIPPGQVFSFNDYLGPQSLDAGFQVGYGIVSTNNGGVQTVPSVAGGICQVATTLFHSVFWAGLPVVERNWHLYWIPRYGQPPRGMTGLDATVDDVGGVDFKFKNTTGNWIAIKAFTSNDIITFQLWGVNPGWQVDASQPVIKNMVKADQTMQYEKDPTMPAGQSLLVEHAEDGFDVTINRVVKQAGQVISNQTFSAHYVPSHNVTLVGTGH